MVDDESGAAPSSGPADGGLPPVDPPPPADPVAPPLPRRARRLPTGGTWTGIVAAGGVLAAFSAPGQTAGLSVFTDPLIAELGVSRTAVSTSYAIGTLIGAAVLPLTGRALDRFGVRRMAVVIGVVFAAFLAGLSVATDIVGVTAGFVGVRMAGQGALSLAATTLVARSITERRGLALGIASGVGSGGISLAPVLVESLIGAAGIRTAWRLEALAVLVVVVGIALALPRTRRPAVIDRPAEDAPLEWTLPQAVRTGMFWVIASGLATSAMIGTALAFHQISVLGAQGLTPAEAAVNFLPQTVTGIAATLLTGALSDRIAPKFGVTISMVTLATAMLLLPAVAPGWTALLYGLVLGAASGSLRGIEAAAYVRYYGAGNIGVIRGVSTGVGLASTAFGPILLALGHDLTGEYVLPVLAGAVLPVAVAVLSVFARAPRHPGG
ncbi:MFS transporter [Amnibacterium endophyticum]|uniref:MFS transporter n=1 Tax=Amnibacterium endophyticum TaxID=2109337 RepID=A0ABW4LDC1_9MICO